MRRSQQQKEALESLDLRLQLVFLFALIVFGVIGFRLWSLQFAERETYRMLAQRNYLRTIKEPALRGRIFDRHGRPLAENIPVYDLVINWDGVPSRHRKTSLVRLAKVIGEDVETVRSSLKGIRADHYGDRVLEEGIEFSRVVAVREAQIPGVEVRIRPMRYYPYGSAAAHLIGYLGEINKEELEREGDPYRIGDWVGKIGLERHYEFDIPVLRGQDGHRKIQVYASGLMSGEIPGGYQPSVPGRDIWTTLDIDLQMVAEEVLGASHGAIVAMDPRTGEILAMTSHPTYDPNAFVRPRLVSERREALKNQFDFALNSGHAFGSIFKIVVATAALEEGTITPEDEIHCSGRIPLGGGYKHCHIWWKYKWGHGDVDLTESLMRSCDVYYYRVGEMVGYENIIQYARSVFGLVDPPRLRYRVEGDPEPFTLIGEDPNPGKNLMARLRKGPRQWFTGDTMNLAIGQGEMAASPLQVNVMMGVMAMGGTLYQPRLVSKITEYDGTLFREYTPQICTQTELKPETVATVKQGLRLVVNNIRGTAYETRIKGLDVLGKTGTSERGRGTDAWYSCFAPGEDPELVVTVALPESGHGGDYAAPLAKKILEKYFEKRLNTEVSQVPGDEENRL